MITVYGKSHCRPCETLKVWLKSKKIEYDYIDVTQDRDAFDRIVSQGYRAVPVIQHKDRYLQGSVLSFVKEYFESEGII